MSNVIKTLQGLLQVATEAIGRRLGSDGPGHDVDVLFLQQAFEPAQLRIAPARPKAIEETADQQIGLLGAAVPGAVAQTSQAGFVIHAAPMRCAGRHAPRAWLRMSGGHPHLLIGPGALAMPVGTRYAAM